MKRLKIYSMYFVYIKILISGLFLLLFRVAYTQDIKNLNYDRAGISVVVLSSNDINKNINELKLDYRYDYNPIIDKIINVSSFEAESIMKELVSKKIASQALLNLTSIEKLIDRVKYNLSENQVELLKSTVRGIETAKDEVWIEKIINNNYILVLEFESVVSQEAIYDKKDLANSTISMLSGGSSSYSKRILEGYKAKVKAILYKIDLNREDYANFIKNWNNSSLQLKYEFKLAYINKIEIDVDGTQLKQDRIYKNLYLKLIDDAVSKCLKEFGDIYFPISLKSSIYSLNPISSKIGTKENLKPDELFFVFEQVERNSAIRLIKKGTLRVKKVAENSKIASENNPSSVFYKIHWSSLQQGMLIVPKQEAGVSLSLGYGYYPYKFYNFQFGKNLSRLLRINNFGQFRLFLDLNYSPLIEDKNPIFDKLSNQFGLGIYESRKLKSLSFGVGIEKEIYLLPGIQLTPFVNINLDKLVYNNLSIIKENYPEFSLPPNYGNVLNANFGFRLPVNLTYNIKLVPSVLYSSKSFNGTTGVGMLDASYSDNIVIDENIFFLIAIKGTF